MKRKQNAETADLKQVTALLEDLKRLAILQLLSDGVQVTQVAKALGVNKSTISRLVPSRGIQKRSAGN